MPYISLQNSTLFKLLFLHAPLGGAILGFPLFLSLREGLPIKTIERITGFLDEKINRMKDKIVNNRV